MAANVTVLGRLVRDPVKRDFGGSSCTAFTLATDSGVKDSTGKHKKPLFIDVTAWAPKADTILQYCKKGSQLLIFGTIYDNDTYNNKQGQPVAKLSLTLKDFEFTANPGGNYQKQAANTNASSSSGGSGDNPDIPF